MHRFLARCVVMLLAVSCSTADSRPASIARDSAGIRIVESTRAQWPEGQGWRLDPEPALSIGLVEGDDVYQFSRIIGVRRFSDGRIAVANQGSDEVRIFDVQGKWLRTIGRRGDGPGEFQSLRSLFILTADSLLAASHFRAAQAARHDDLDALRHEDEEHQGDDSEQDGQGFHGGGPFRGAVISRPDPDPGARG